MRAERHGTLAECTSLVHLQLQTMAGLLTHLHTVNEGRHLIPYTEFQNGALNQDDWCGCQPVLQRCRSRTGGTASVLGAYAILSQEIVGSRTARGPAGSSCCVSHAWLTSPTAQGLEGRLSCLATRHRLQLLCSARVCTLLVSSDCLMVCQLDWSALAVPALSADQLGCPGDVAGWCCCVARPRTPARCAAEGGAACSFMYGAAVKARLLRFANEVEQMREFRHALMSTLMSGGNVLPFLYLKVRQPAPLLRCARCGLGAGCAA